MAWANTGSNLKSNVEVQRLVDDVLLAPDFDLEDLRRFRVTRELERLDSIDKPGHVFSSSDGWHETSVKIPVPKEGSRFASEAAAPTFEVGEVFVRKLTEVVRCAAEATDAFRFNWLPFRMYWHRIKQGPLSTAAESDSGSDSDGVPEYENIRIFSDVPDTDAMIEEDARLRAQPRNPEDGPEVEYAIAPILLWSDSTHLANFGGAHLWPIYVYFGWLTKYIRGCPTKFAAHHLAYIPSDWYQNVFGTSATAETLRFCRKELMHAIWRLLLDEDFMKAYHEGMLVLCGDGILRRLFPRFFIYSADYPEKPGLHSLINRVRNWVFKQGYSLTSKFLRRIIDPVSILPTRSAFSERLADTGFNFYSLFVPDILHEFELGVWKAIFIHLLRILYAEGKDRIQIVNERFRKIPPFGRSTIRRFSRNVSGLKQMAGRDFEDILQCIMPVFEGLLPPPHDDLVMSLLFTLAFWHALAKLRLHTEETVAIFHGVTWELGRTTREFAATTCEAYDTQELPAEEAARGCRTAAMRAKKSSRSKKKVSSSKGATKNAPGPKRKTLNLKTGKWHSLGDYAWMVGWYGTHDVGNTQQGEQEHRRVKRFYVRTNKNKAARQIARRQRREQLLTRLLEKDRQRRAELTAGTQQARPQGNDTAQKQSSLNKTVNRPRNGTLADTARRRAALWLSEEDPLPFHTTPKDRYHMSDSERHHENIFRWANARLGDDPALRNFVPNLKDHLLSRLTGREYDGDEDTFGPDEHDTIQFVNDRIYLHKALRINYTTYDMRRSQDSINPRRQADVMLLAPHEDDGDSQANAHPYWYARVIGIFHVNVKHRGLLSRCKDVQRMDVLWIRWFGRDLSEPGGFKARRLHRVGFIDSDEPNAFGFLDPAQVLRASHLIPGFTHGKTTEYLPPSIARQPEDNDEDYIYHYVGMFADRDMVMRYLGGAVGHKGLPSNRITIQHLIDKVRRFIHRCSQTRSIRYPKETLNLNDALVDKLWADTNAPSADSPDVPKNDAMAGGDAEDSDTEEEDAVPSDEEDFGYGWDYPEDQEDDETAGEEPVDEQEVDDEAELGPEDDYPQDDDEDDGEGYAPL
ncbi:uncharacterized protein B0H18DRAFT_1105032 [Fomitopsis serialis]|uniref:uncharacterized protein n=1 Tax=Fomitopsis serialis TaxID=139415 RepID=UPI00200871FD|nr:uncharacterized protein B0H18DRAFT_1105032 [Neoantrodia serialis]KAH9924456.1 hypothetical protein B0H18DRAFT_1105032 [Neoantrodia serialis]